MNKKMIVNTLSKIVILESVLLLLPALTGLIYKETTAAISYALTAVGAFLLGLFMYLLSKKRDETIFAKEGFVIAALAWVVMSLIGAVPFVLSGDIPSFVDALFEMVSGFTTTGSSIVDDVTALSHATLFWRSFSHWVGGMGVLVLMMAIVPDDSGRTIHIMRAEMPGPVVDKIVPRIRDTAKIFYIIYMVMTAVQVLLLTLGEMDFFEALLHTLGTAGTGGFGIKPDSVGSYSAYSQWVITVFMILFGVNFNIYYMTIIRRVWRALKSEELFTYLGLIALSVVLISVNVAGMYETLEETIRHSAFQVAAIITTTGYSTVNFDLWGTFPKAIMLLLMFIGGCAGSTAGGFKVSRVVILFKNIKSELKKLIHPRSVTAVRFEGKVVEPGVRNGIAHYLSIYIILFALILLVITLEPFDFETNFSAVATCFNNVGPGFGKVGPLFSFSGYSDLSTVLLTLAMLLGRLEIYPIVVLLSLPFTRKK